MKYCPKTNNEYSIYIWVILIVEQIEIYEAQKCAHLK